jgi:hypothetical protein
MPDNNVIRYGKCKAGNQSQVVDTGNARSLRDALVKLAKVKGVSRGKRQSA